MPRLRQLLDCASEQRRGLQIPVKETRNFVGAGRNLSALEQPGVQQSLQIEFQLLGDVLDHRIGVREDGTPKETLHPAQQWKSRGDRERQQNRRGFVAPAPFDIPLTQA